MTRDAAVRAVLDDAPDKVLDLIKAEYEVDDTFARFYLELLRNDLDTVLDAGEKDYATLPYNEVEEYQVRQAGALTGVGVPDVYSHLTTSPSFGDEVRATERTTPALDDMIATVLEFRLKNIYSRIAGDLL